GYDDGDNDGGNSNGKDKDNGGGGSSTAGRAKTSDSSRILSWIALFLLACLSAIVGVLARRRSRSRQL
ncbi:MAG: hypothetical protein J6D07_04125, partial [Mogibacterium sp.]|nr:hypothetical protein [Mogibacterium sp.]